MGILWPVGHIRLFVPIQTQVGVGAVVAALHNVSVSHVAPWEY